jgi:hypothetical protein
MSISLKLTCHFYYDIGWSRLDWGERKVSEKQRSFGVLADLGEFPFRVTNRLKRRRIMIIKPSYLASSRREFLLNIIPAGSLFCFGCGSMSAWIVGQEEQKAAEKKHKFLEDSGMSFQEVFEFAYKSFARMMKSLGDEIGKDNLVEMMKRIIDNEINKEALKEAKDFQVKDFASFRAGERKEPDRFWWHVQTYTIVEDTDKAIESRVTECLFAKTLRDADAADIGYAYFCYGDFAMARAYNPKLRLIRTKTLMNGDDCCNHRYVWEG